MSFPTPASLAPNSVASLHQQAEFLYAQAQYVQAFANLQAWSPQTEQAAPAAATSVDGDLLQRLVKEEVTKTLAGVSLEKPAASSKDATLETSDKKEVSTGDVCDEEAEVDAKRRAMFAASEKEDERWKDYRMKQNKEGKQVEKMADKEEKKDVENHCLRPKTKPMPRPPKCLAPPAVCLRSCSCQI